MTEKFISSINGNDLFERRYNEGYTKVAFGGEGELIGNTRIVRVVAFFHPTRYFREVATYQDSNFHCGIYGDQGKSFEKNYTGKGFEKYILDNRIPMGNRQDLLEILECW